METKFNYQVSANGAEWTNQIEIKDMDQERKYICLDIASGRGMSYFLILNIYQGQIILTIPYHDLGLFISPPNDPEYLFLKLSENDINSVDVNNIVWGLSKIWNELFVSEEEQKNS